MDETIVRRDSLEPLGVERQKRGARMEVCLRAIARDDDEEAGRKRASACALGVRFRHVILFPAPPAPDVTVSRTLFLWYAVPAHLAFAPPFGVRWAINSKSTWSDESAMTDERDDRWTDPTTSERDGVGDDLASWPNVYHPWRPALSSLSIHSWR